MSVILENRSEARERGADAGTVPAQWRDAVRKTGNGIAIRSWACAGMLAVSACGGAAEVSEAPREVDRSAPVDPAFYAGEVEFRIAENLATLKKDVPFALYLGLAPAAETRLGANAFVDLRDLQIALPDLLTGVIEPSCGLGLDVRFDGAEAVGDLIRARATTDARLYRCRNSGTDAESRGIRFLTQTIDIEATVSAGIEGECIAFHLVDLDLVPRGLLGRVSTLFGVTDRARSAILAQTRETLSDNPVCPDLPPALALLDPQFSAFTLREVGDRGMGASLSGSVDLDAGALVDMLALVQARANAPEAGSGPAASPGRLDGRIDSTLDIGGTEIAYTVDVGLAAAGPTRIDVETRLDLRNLQSRLPDLLAGRALVNICGGSIDLNRLEAEATGRSVALRGLLGVNSYDCTQTEPGTWMRGKLLDATEIAVRADLSAEIVESCVVFRLLDLSRDPPGAFVQLETGSGRVEAARELLLEAAWLLLEEAALCPDFPPELAVLDLRLDSIAPEEIGDGGVGIDIDGSIDVSPETVIALLRLLQARGAVPPPP